MRLLVVYKNGHVSFFTYVTTILSEKIVFENKNEFETHDRNFRLDKYVFRIFLYEIKRAMPRVVVAVCPAVAPLAVNWWPATERLRGLVEVHAWPR